MEDYDRIKTIQQQTWASGDYAKIGGRLLIVSEMLCEAADLRAGQYCLDVATGSGNTALAAARRNCRVTGVDYVPAWLRVARERAAAERLEISFQEGDAECLPFPDASFDCVLSTFGVMFAPDQVRATSEVLRVCRSGAKIALANWTPNGFGGRFFKTIASHVPPPTGVPSAMRWGTEDGIQALFGEHLSSLRINTRSFVHRSESAQLFIDDARRDFGPVVSAFAALKPAGQACLADDLIGVTQEFNRSGDNTIVVPQEYLEVVAIKNRTRKPI